MRYYYDTEFLDTGERVYLLSIGIVAEDGRKLHLVNAEAPWEMVRKNPWLMSNVVPHLNALATSEWLPRAELRTAVRDFLRSPMGTGSTELWAWYGAYDHVLLMQLLSHDGQFSNVPLHVPHWTNDIRQKQWEMGDVPLPQQSGGHHNALRDAEHVMLLHQYLEAKSTQPLGQSQPQSKPRPQLPARRS